METAAKNWFVDIDGTVYEATTETIDQWIWDGTMLANHRVSREGARWLEAGKAPQFVKHFPSSQETNDLLGSEGIGARTVPPRPPELQAGKHVSLPSSVRDQPNTFGVRLLGGSGLALIVALVAGYLWAYQFTAPKDLSLINDSPEIQKLQSNYDTEKAKFEERKAAAAKPIPAGVSQNLNNGGQPSIDCDRKDAVIAMICSEAGRKDAKEYGKMEEKIQPVVNKADSSASIDNSITDLNTKFESEKKKIVAEARATESKSKFYEVFVLLFLGLAGLNIARLSLFQKK